LANNVGIVRVRNKENVFHIGDPDATASAAGATLKKIPVATGTLTGFSIAWANDAASYPIATYSYLLVRQDLRDLGVAGCAIKAFLTWSQSDAAQANAIAFDLVPLPKSVLQINRDIISTAIKVVDDATVASYLALTPTVIVINDAPLIAAAPRSLLADALLALAVACVLIM